MKNIVAIFKQKKLFFWSLLVLLFVFSVIFYIKRSNAAATTCYWVGDTSPAAWNDASHWSSSSGGSGGTCDGGIVPGSDDTVIFDSANTNSVEIDMAASVAVFTISSGYTGTITILAGQSLTTSGAFNMADGVFNGGTSDVTIGGVYTLTGGVFNAGSTTTFKNDFTHTTTTGTYNAGTNTIFDGNWLTYIDLRVNSTETFNNVEIKGTAGDYALTIDTGDTMIVLGDLTLTGGHLNGGTVDARGNIIQSAGFVGGTTYLDFGNNSVNQTYTINGGTGPQLRFDNSADALDSLVMSADGALNSITITSGFGNANTVQTTYNSHTLSLTNSTAFVQNSGTFNASDPMYIYGNFTLTDGVFNAGTTLYHGRHFTHTTTTGTYNEATNTIFNAHNNYNTLDVNVTETFNNVEIYSSNPVYGISLASNDTMVVLGNLTLTDGYIGGASGSIVDVRGNITQAATFGTDNCTANLSFGNNSVAQTYTINGGYGPGIRFDDPADVNDRVINNSEADLFFYGDITITADFGDTNTVPIDYDGYNMTVRQFTQASGIFNSPTSTFTNTGNFTLTGGIFNAAQTTTHGRGFSHTTATGTYNEGATTRFTLSDNVIMHLNASEEFNDVEIAATNGGYSILVDTGDTMIVNGNLTFINGGFHTSWGKGVIEARGNVLVESTADCTNGKLNFAGTADQIYTINGPAPTGVNTYNKTSGSLTINHNTSTAVTLTMSSTTQNIGDLYLAANSTANLTLTGATNNPAVNVLGNIDFIGTGDGTESIITGTGTWSIGKNIDFTGGTFNHSNGLVVLNGSVGQTIFSAGQTFNNLTVTNTHPDGIVFADSATISGTFTDVTQDSKLTFADGATYNFASVDINGTDGHPITMTKGVGTDGHWYFNVAETNPTVTYVAVDHSDASGSTDSIDATVGGIDNGLNINWEFPLTVPDPPTNVSAVAGNAQATVTFTPPENNGGSPITSYTVTSNPGSITATGTESPIIINGLTNGVEYTFTVHATNAVGDSEESEPSNAVKLSSGEQSSSGNKSIENQDDSNNSNDLSLIEPQSSPIIKTDRAENTFTKKETITLDDFSYYIILASANLPFHSSDGKGKIEVLANTEILIEIPADLFKKEVNVITVTTPNSAYIMNYLKERNKYQVVIPTASEEGDFDLEILIVYKDGTVQNLYKEIKVNPKGYVFSKISMYFGLGRKQEARVAGAKVTLYKIDDNGENNNIWNSNGEKSNSVYTNESGEYSFWVSPGTYYLTIEKRGYRTVKTESFKIENNLVNRKIEIQPKMFPWWWLILLIILSSAVFIFFKIKKIKKVRRYS